MPLPLPLLRSLLSSLAFPPSGASPLVSSFTRAFPSVIWITSRRRKVNLQRTSVSIRCEQGTKENNGLDVWLGRFAMVGFATAITVEISTGKGLLENFGFIIPQPTLAFVVITCGCSFDVLHLLVCLLRLIVLLCVIVSFIPFNETRIV